MSYFKTYIILVFLFVLTNNLKAQDTLNSGVVEQKSYQLYVDKNWTELIKFGNQAIKQGFDYFYLQLRIGIAYYEKKNYAVAEKYFLNALKFNSDDELILEYIYYCYIFNARYQEARVWSKKFSPSLIEKIGIDKQSSVSLVMIETGSKITDKPGYYNEVTKTNSNYFNPPFYFHLGLNHYVKNKVSLFHSLTYFNQQTFINKVSQSQYYLKVAIPFKNNWILSPAAHVIHIKTTTEVRNPPKQPMPGTGPPRKPEPTFNVTQSDYVVGSLLLQKTIKKTVFGIGSSISNMNNKTQFIHSGFLSYAPLGNSKIVLGCTGYLHTIDSYQTFYGAVVPFIYLQPFNKLSLKLSYLYNEKNNFIEENGYLVNNSPDVTQKRYSALINFNINKNVDIYGLYQLEYKYEAIQSFNYRYNVIVAGVKITPFKK